MVEHEPLAEGLVDGGDEDQDIRWVVGVHHVEAAPHEGDERQRQHHDHRIPVLEEVPHQPTSLGRGRVLIQRYSRSDLLPYGSGLRAARTDDRHPMTGRHQGGRLGTHPGVLPVWVVLQQHQDAERVRRADRLRCVDGCARDAAN